MLGIDPDYRLHVSDHLLVQNDGPQLELLKQLHKQKLHLPKRLQDYPDRDRLAQRFKTFLTSR
jgi:putative restriction endonuclease